MNLFDSMNFPGPLNRERILFNLKTSVIYRKEINRAGYVEFKRKEINRADYIKFKNRVDSLKWGGEMLDRYLACSLMGFEAIKINLREVHETPIKKQALEHLLTQLLSGWEYMTGRKFDEETYRMISEIDAKLGTKQKQGKGKRGRTKTCQYIEDEKFYNTTTCYLILKAGAGFFKVLHDNKSCAVCGKEPAKQAMCFEHDPLDKLEILLNCHRKTIKNQFIKQKEADEEYERMALEQQGKKPKDRKAEESGLPGEFILNFDEDLKPSHLNFIEDFQHFFTTTCKNAGITEFTFPIKEITRTPQGVLTCLIENLHKQIPPFQLN